VVALPCFALCQELSSIRASRRKNCCKEGCDCSSDKCPCRMMGVNCHKEGVESEQGCGCRLPEDGSKGPCANPHGRYYFDPDEATQPSLFSPY